jgi:hypothetical protein
MLEKLEELEQRVQALEQRYVREVEFPSTPKHAALPTWPTGITATADYFKTGTTQ